ncbi:hypothetical protein Calkr_2260 [Caldicellulosiruptor acetigenus I77R1B]|uniref:Uncharacterized protein n=1 Tax=Caldicellulosiruptor acetigenus (strain ATCC 700853 / DSM 12137 / I77R1B) TaxID=632335 RepID=E4S6T8_CALA7|nr:DUF6062 family protein [Caldicellulosiruptor acetigenus]ADQ41721.1 hypothetical protein Calkr_2260 [Caldicellulosiruptor acetigenus I77R1B]
MPQGIPWMADNCCPYKCGQEFFAFLKGYKLFEKDLGGWTLDIVYFEMIENLKEDKCIICYLKNKAMDKFFDDFLYESVNDHSLRDRIRKGGICPEHARKLESFGDVLAHAIIYSDLLSSFKNNHHIEILPRKRKTQEQNMCVFCEKEQGFEDTYTRAFSYYWAAQSQFKSAFSERGFICQRHLNQVLEKMSSMSVQKDLLSVVKHKIDIILHHLEKIKEKNDYRNIHESYTPEEVRAWHMAVEFVAGSKK